jgi:hypothetical protein
MCFALSISDIGIPPQVKRERVEVLNIHKVFRVVWFLFHIAVFITYLVRPALFFFGYLVLTINITVTGQDHTMQTPIILIQ